MCRRVYPNKNYYKIQAEPCHTIIKITISTKSPCVYTIGTKTNLVEM